MYYLVLRPFINIDGAFYNAGDKIGCDHKRSLQLRRNGLIGNIAELSPKEKAEKKQVLVENTIEKPTKRKYRKRLKTEDKEDD